MNPFNKSKTNPDPVRNQDKMYVDNDSQSNSDYSEAEQLMVEGKVEYNSDDYDMELQSHFIKI